jgi:hypothetical protein
MLLEGLLISLKFCTMHWVTGMWESVLFSSRWEFCNISRFEMRMRIFFLYLSLFFSCNTGCGKLTSFFIWIYSYYIYYTGCGKLTSFLYEYIHIYIHIYIKYRVWQANFLFYMNILILYILYRVRQANFLFLYEYIHIIYILYRVRQANFLFYMNTSILYIYYAGRGKLTSFFIWIYSYYIYIIQGAAS